MGRQCFHHLSRKGGAWRTATHPCVARGSANRKGCRCGLLPEHHKGTKGVVVTFPPPSTRIWWFRLALPCALAARGAGKTGQSFAFCEAVGVYALMLAQALQRLLHESAGGRGFLVEHAVNCRIGVVFIQAAC
jgi:hypothetical protein